jgi:hypothetical protein
VAAGDAKRFFLKVADSRFVSSRLVTLKEQYTRCWYTDDKRLWKTWVLVRERKQQEGWES